MGAASYKLVTDINQLPAGSKFIIANPDGTQAMINYASGNNCKTEAVTCQNDVIELSESSSVAVVTLEGGDNQWYFSTSAGYLYAAGSAKSGNYLKAKGTKDDASKVVTLSVSTDGTAVITFAGSAKAKNLRYNANNGSPLFACYSGSATNTITNPRLFVLQKIPVDPTKETPKLTFAESSLNLDFGTSKAAPTLTASVDGLSISYKSGDEAVVTYDAETGMVTAVGEGTTTITATSAETEQYNSASASFTVTVAPKMELFSRATSVVSGQKYVLVVGNKVATGMVGNNPPTYEAGKFGFMQVADVEVADDILETAERYALVVTACEGGYTLQNYLGNYVCQQGTYDSFNVYADTAKGAVWSIEPQSDGTMKITNVSVNKYVQYSEKYTSFGSYADANAEADDTRLLPMLYQLGEIEEAPAMPEFDSDDTDVIIIAAEGTTIYYKLSDTEVSSSVVKRAIDLEAEGWIKNPDTANPHELMLSKDDLKGKTIEYMAVSASGLQSEKGMFAVADDGVVTGIEGVEAETAEARVEWFNMQGVRVANPEAGLYIRRQGNKVEKVTVK